MRTKPKGPNTEEWIFYGQKFSSEEFSLLLSLSQSLLHQPNIIFNIDIIIVFNGNKNIEEGSNSDSDSDWVFSWNISE